MKDEWKRLYEKYENRKSRIIIRILLITIAVIVISGVILFMYSYLFSNELPNKIPSALPSTDLQKINSDLSKAISPGSYKMQIDVPDMQCYWLRSTTNENGFVLEVREYNSSTKNCIGEFLNSTEIPLTKPLNLLGNDCICGKKICELENILEDNRTNLKIKGC